MRRILLAAGGTGGHIIPAIAFGRWIAEAHPEVEVGYLCGARELERSIYEASGLTPAILDIQGSPFGVRGLDMIKRSAKIAGAFFDARRVIKTMRPDLCLMFGGYVSAPVFAAAKSCGIRTAMHEQNAVAGRVTRLAARFGARIASGWRICEPLGEGGFTYTGTPVRRFSSMSAEDAWRELGMKGEMPNGPIAVVMTGSLGSERILGILEERIACGELEGWTILAVLSSGGEIVEHSPGVYVLPKMWDPSPLFAAADVVISRAGASTLSELIELDIPSIAIPWRGAAGDHQLKNAKCFTDEKKRKMWDEKSENSDVLVRILNDLRAYADRRGRRERDLAASSAAACEALWRLIS